MWTGRDRWESAKSAVDISQTPWNKSNALLEYYYIFIEGCVNEFLNLKLPMS